MLRSVLLTALAAACLVATADAGAASPTAWVKVSSCSRLTHSASFYGRMKRVRSANRMAMRFTLLQRAEDDDAFVPLHAAPLAHWRKSKTGVGGFGYRQRVKGLADGSLYRMQVDYRWLDADGDVIKHTHRTSKTCSQAGPLPNLRVKVVDSSPTQLNGVRRYHVRVFNRGSAVARGFDVAFSVDGAAVDSKRVDALDAKASRQLTFRGPDCESGVQATVDPTGTVLETDEQDNARAVTCAQLPAG
jgi:hypothetical protein